ncbi:MAG TPA: hypothetical protein VFD56_04150 [Chitinophagaceae bacterium]|nr:hypothetical protein [Chitinophagaceae bacterium]
MTKPINSYKELIEEKARLKALLTTQKTVLRQDFTRIKEEFTPVRTAISVIGKITTKDNSNWLLTNAADTVIDMIVKKIILSKAGWFSRLVLPFFMKNLSSHLIADNKDKIFNKIASWFGGEKSNGKAHFPKKEVTENLAEEEED